jgi:N-acetylglucosaminyldiphosphoundecaprenol N-acetyl-beta-D-mannosaminyltransferase
MSVAVFVISALLMLFTSRLPLARERRAHGFRPEGIAFVGSVLVCAALGFLTTARPSLPQSAAQEPDWGLQVLALTAALYALSALRGARRLPPWVADALVVAAALVALYVFRSPSIGGLTLPFAGGFINSGRLAAGLTVLFVWAIARMTASLNRTPQVTGGYLGMVSLTLLLSLHFSNHKIGLDTSFSVMACAALAGAGLASVPAALKLPGFNIGWSASLTMGFLLGQIAVSGLFKNLAFAIMGLLLLVFGLPALDVSFYHLRAAKRGGDVAFDHSRQRLHQVLMRRGLSPLKVSLLYLAVAAFLCGLGLLVILTEPWHLALRLLLLISLGALGFLCFFSLVRILMRRGADEEVPETVEAFGVKISVVSMQQALDRIDTFIEERVPRHVATSDANAILTAQKDPLYAQILRRAALITPDGYGVIWGVRLMNLPIYERVTGVDMVTGICERGARKGYSIYILGSEPGVAATAAANLQAKYPGLKVAGTHHGFWRRDAKEDGLDADAADARMADTVRAAKPDVLFVAMGIPSQEKFIAAQLERLAVPVALGVGGSFDVYSGKFNRAPASIQRIGLEWLYRVWVDPTRWKKMGYVPRFMALAVKTWLFGDHASKPKRAA